MSERLGDAPIEEAYRERMNAIAAFLDEYFNQGTTGDDRKVGFVMLVYEFGEHDGRCNFISNGAGRKDLVVLFKEMIKRFEGQPEMTGHA